MYRTIEICLCFPFTFSDSNDWKKRQVQVSFNNTNKIVLIKKNIEFSIHTNMNAVNLRISEHSVKISYSRQRRMQITSPFSLSITQGT